MGTSLKSSTSRGAVRISLRAKLVRVLPKSATSDRELATLQSTRKVPSTATVRRETAVRIAAEEHRNHDPAPENAGTSIIFNIKLCLAPLGSDCCGQSMRSRHKNRGRTELRSEPAEVHALYLHATSCRCHPHPAQPRGITAMMI